jgi:adenylate cyclase
MMTAVAPVKTEQTLTPEEKDEGAKIPVFNTVAVLRFVDLSSEGHLDAFCAGLTEEVSMALSQLGGTRVAGRSQIQGRDLSGDLREIGRQLGVEGILEGSVRRFDGRMCITVRLAETDTGFSVWGNRYLIAWRDDLLEMQEEIGVKVASDLLRVGWGNSSI